MTAWVLAYHSHNISGREYATNDHVALASDLETLHRVGARIVPLGRIADLVREGAIDGETGLLVGLSFDDGPVFDYADFTHPRFGVQRGFLRILEDFIARHGVDAQPGLCATSFVIASPEARRAMERAEDCGYPFLENWLGDHWWHEASATGLIEIGNHSWDHVHHAPDRIAADVRERDNFTLVDNEASADAEIRRASDYINSHLPQSCRLFAYPFGHVNAYLMDDYLPNHVSEHGLEAAFGVDARPVTNATSVWNIPRAVCGHHWRSSAELEGLLA